MGRAREVWDGIVQTWTTGDVDGVPELFTADAVYHEPYNPPHTGNLLIQAYLKDYLDGKLKLVVEELRAFETADGTGIAVEWTLSYDAAGRRWNALPRMSVLEVNDDGMAIYLRDYT